MPLIRHLVLVRFLPSANPLTLDSVCKNLIDLRSQQPSTLYYSIFPLSSASSSSAGFTHVIDSVFSSPDALSFHIHLPAYQAVVRNLLHPILHELLVLDYALPDAFDVDAFRTQQAAPHVRQFTLFRAKLGKEGEAQAISAALEGVSEGGTVAVTAGRQENGLMYAGYNDLSQGMTHCVERLMKDEGGVKALDDSPAYAKVLQQHEDDIDRRFTFDYEAGHAVDVPGPLVRGQSLEAGGK